MMRQGAATTTMQNSATHTWQHQCFQHTTWQYASKPSMQKPGTHTHTHTHARTHTHTHLAAPISPAAWRHLSPGDILVASGVPGSWPESERTVPPELLACSFLPAALEHVSSVIIIIVIMMMTIIIIIVVVVVSIKNRFPAHDELGTCSDKSCLSSLSCASLKGL